MTFAAPAGSVESLARHRASKADFVCDALSSLRQGRAAPVLHWLEPFVVTLSGAMRLEPAAPLLVERLRADSLFVSCAAVVALARLNGDAVVRAIADAWPEADADFRAAAAEVLGRIHTDRCAEACLSYLAAEKADGARLPLAHAVLSNLVDAGLDPVRRVVLGNDEETMPGCLDVRRRLVVACLILGSTLPELNPWYEDAVANNWGIGDQRPARLADRFRPELAPPE